MAHAATPGRIAQDTAAQAGDLVSWDQQAYEQNRTLYKIYSSATVRHNIIGQDGKITMHRGERVSLQWWLDAPNSVYNRPREPVYTVTTDDGRTADLYANALGNFAID